MYCNFDKLPIVVGRVSEIEFKDISRYTSEPPSDVGMLPAIELPERSKCVR